jgi:sugar phosphate isomerase/epimerase
MPAFSYQLYSSRKFPPIARTLSMLAAAGYREVEGFGGAIEAAGGVTELRALLDANGLKMPTAHFAIETAEASPNAVIADARRLGVSVIVIPWLQPADRPNDVAGWVALGRRVERLAQPLMASGFSVAWHNHDFELVPLANGHLPLKLMLDAAPSVKLELDVAWAHVAGMDPCECIRRWRDRLVTVHIKDRAPDGKNAKEDGWADVGQGVLDWPSIIKAVRNSPARHVIMEHDNPSDHERFARNSITFMSSIWG